MKKSPAIYPVSSSHPGGAQESGYRCPGMSEVPRTGEGVSPCRGTAGHMMTKLSFDQGVRTTSWWRASLIYHRQTSGELRPDGCTGYSGDTGRQEIEGLLGN